MIRPRWKKVLADIWDNKVRTLLVVLSIAVGVFSIGMIAGAYAIISHDMSSGFQNANPANIEIWTDPFDDTLIQSIEDINGVRDVEGRKFTNLRVEAFAGQWQSIDLVGIANFSSQKINFLKLISGKSIPDFQEVLIERDGLKKIPVEPGQTLSFLFPDGSLKTLTVTGIVQDQATGAGDFLSPPIGFVTTDTMEWLQQSNQYNRLLATVSINPNDEDSIRQIATSITDKLENSGRQIYRQEITKSNEHPMTATVQAILGVLGVLGILIVILSSSLIANTLNALLNQHLPHIGVMKLIGAQSRQIFTLYVVLILSFGILALFIAIPAGAQAAYALSELIAFEMNFSLSGFRIIPQAIFLQIFVSIAVPLIAGFFPINTGARISVRKAISGSVNTVVEAKSNLRQGKTGSSMIGQFLDGVPRPALISLRNTFRRKGRLLLTLFTLTMGGAIFIAVFNVRTSLDQYIHQIGNYFLADVTITFDRPYRTNEISNLAMKVKGVQKVEGWSFASAEVLYPDGRIAENIQILAPPAGSTMVDPILLSGRWLTSADKNSIAVSEALLKTLPNLKPGDWLPLKINGKDYRWMVVGIFKFVSSDAVIAYANFDQIAPLNNLSNRSFSYRIVTVDHSEEYQRTLASELDQYFRNLGFFVREVEPGLSSLQTASEGLEVLVRFLLIMALLTTTVGSMGLTGTISMNVLERTREIGIMRSIGAVDAEIIKTVILEGVTTGGISWFMGAILSFPISVLLGNIISLAIFSTPIDLVFTYQGYGIWFLVVLLLSALASIVPARNAARLTIREVLAYE